MRYLDAPITVEEIVGVIKHLPSDKAPGLDGYTAEFYKSFSEDLAPLLLNTYNESFQEGRLPPSLSEAIITLILKKEKDPTDCKSYRPISLTSYDSEILSKILANRLNRVITSLVHVDQVGFISSRSSVDNIRRLIDIMWAVQDGSPIAAILLDAEKAFDRVEWRYLFATLECFGFTKSFINWIQLIYVHPKASVLTNGIIGPSFELGRGTRQGDPLSPLLFALALEPLAVAIRREPNFPGVNIGRDCHKLLLYADDILLFISDPEKSLNSLQAIINTFSAISGYKVNWTKSEALPLTSYCPRSLFQTGMFSWPEKGIKYLGVTFPPHLSDLIKINFEPLLSDMKINIDRWSQMYLSMWGKVNVIKMVCTPKFNYLLQALPIHVPLKYIKQFDQLCKAFIWNNKKPRLNLRKLQKPADRGGLGMPNLLLYHYAFSLWHLAHWFLPPEKAPPWFSIESTACSPFTPLYSLSTNLSPHIQSHPVFSHLKEIWKRMSKLFKFDPYLNQSAGIWYNPKLSIAKLPFFWKLWFQRGITVLGGLYENSTFKSFEKLVEEFDLPKQEFWKYLQLRHLMANTFSSSAKFPSSCNFLEEIKKTFGRGQEASAYYKMLLLASDPNTLSLKRTWEMDLSLSFTVEEWNGILRNLKKMSR
uniref:Reverse transcriptase domain-containing protein n=1 Tax=Oreochromis niloticus TaxID=8128 RepID=A0A669DHM2_ORENI